MPNQSIVNDEITEFVNSLSHEAIQAGVEAIEQEVIGDQMICFPEHVKSVIESVLRASHKVCQITYPRQVRSSLSHLLSDEDRQL